MARLFEFAVVEGYTELAVTEKIFHSLGVDLPTIANKRGGSAFWKDAPRLNRSATNLRIFGLVDLERAVCPAALIGKYLGRHLSANFVLRVAVRMVESWLLADREAAAKTLGVPLPKMPRRPDDVAHPKRELIDLARCSSKASVRRALVPEQESGALVGADYGAFLDRYVREAWRPRAAAEASPSLERALAKIDAMLQ